MPGMATACWVWIAGKNSDGYGNFQYSGKCGRAHRFSYELHIGPIPEGMEVRHGCHVPACVNPAHFQLGTHADNMRDMAMSGRRKEIRYRERKEAKVIKPKTVEERFWEKVDKNGPIMPHMDTPCWIWMASAHALGYGRFWPYGKKSVLAHRFSYEITFGSIPGGLDILHECDVPACVNPAHIRPGTHTENMRDMEAKGRRRPATGKKHWTYLYPEKLQNRPYGKARNLPKGDNHWARKNPHLLTRGEQSNFAKLTEVLVLEIRQRWQQESPQWGLQKKLALEYGLSRHGIAKIIKRKIWKHI